MWCSIVVLFFAVLASAENNTQWKIVNIKQGPVRGHLHPGGDCYVFYDIPYAAVPTGRNRFKAPLAAPVWMHTFDAVNRGIVCPQFQPRQRYPDHLTNMQEDCLVATVYTPDSNNTNLPVIVYVHGGAYQFGFGNMYEHPILVKNFNVVVVSFNYRLGPFGFTCLGTKNIPGNAGLKDQLALLRWVKENIASFGGNPDNITHAGCSSGGGNVDLITLSRATKGLFNKAIVESSFSLGLLGVQHDPVKNAKTYARLLNFDRVDDINDLEEFYLTASFDLLLSHNNDVLFSRDSLMIFAPCVESDVGEERVIEDAPINILKKGSYPKVPLIFGISSEEGLMMSPYFESWKNEISEGFSDFLPINNLQFKDENEMQNVSKAVKEFYFGTQPLNETSILSFIDYYTDIHFGHPMLWELSIRVGSHNDEIYLHQYSFKDENTPLIPNTDVRGVGHCGQHWILLDNNEINITEEYRIMRAAKNEYWHNFIWTGSPGMAPAGFPAWPRVNANRSPYMSFGKKIQLKDGLLQDRFNFWNGIFEKHYRMPAAPQLMTPATDNATMTDISNIFFLSRYIYELLFNS